MSVNTRKGGKGRTNTLVTSVQSPSLAVRSESDCRLNELSTMLLDKLSEMESRLMDKISVISAEVSNMRSDLKASFTRLATVEKKISDVVVDVLSLSKRLRTIENAAIASDCIVYNVPNTADADAVVDSALVALECTHIEPVKVFRTICKKNIANSANKRSPLIVKLKSPDDRVTLFKAIAAFKKKQQRMLKLSNVGLESNVNLSIFESLTIENRGLLNAALELRKNNIISAAFSMRGSVYIRVRDIDKAVVINDVATLHKFTGTTAV